MTAGLDHDVDCNCEKCIKEFLHYKVDRRDEILIKKELRAYKLLELAEQEGGLKQYITGLLEVLPNYNKICNCIMKKLSYDEDLGDRKHRDVCLRCGGIQID